MAKTNLLLILGMVVSISASGQTAQSPAAGDKGGVSAPRITFSTDPEYTDKAREAHFQGVCTLEMVVGEDGTPREIKVLKKLGMGLDEKAVEAVKLWKFEPARKNGVPVAVKINVEVSFRLYPELSTSPKIAELTRKALGGDPESIANLGLAYINADSSTANRTKGLKLLEYAAQRGSARAQFELAQQIVKSPPTQGDADYVSAYAWYGIAKRNGHKVKDKIFQQLESRMTADQLAEARSRIDKWQPTPAK